jgi:hypothetical protein
MKKMVKSDKKWGPIFRSLADLKCVNGLSKLFWLLPLLHLVTGGKM